MRARLSVSNEQAAAHFIGPSEDAARYRKLAAHIAGLWGTAESHLMECNDCTFGFAWPFIAGDQEFYRLAYPRSSYPRMKWEFQKTIDTWRPAGAGPVLEIGAGDGFFLDILRSNGRLDGREVVATEYYDSAIDQLRAKGYRAVQGDVRKEALPSDQFSAIFMFQVLEHMDGVGDLFGTLHRIMAPGGDLFVAVPNKHRTQFNEDHGSLIDCPPNHVGRWTGRAFREAGRRFGFEVVEDAVEPFSIGAFIKSDIHYSHRRRSQQAGSLAGLARSVKPLSLRRLAIQAEAAAMAPTRLSTWAKARSDGKLGGALWAHLRRQG